MTTAPVDPRYALDTANASDLVQKKVSIDAMRKRVSGGQNEEKKLREACEGFESIFLQKMWEQMRKNVKKEGYLHSKDEEAYQSMFDTELAKKMASAGGIGLADMLYEQLGQKLSNSSKTTGLGSMRKPLPIEPARPEKPKTEETAEKSTAPEDLYTEAEAREEPVKEDPAQKLIEKTLAEIAESRDPALDPANATYPMFDLQTGSPLNPVAGKMKEESEPKREVAVTPLPERVSAPGKTKPSNALRGVGRSARHSRRSKAATGAAAQPVASPVKNQTPAQNAASEVAPTAAEQGRWPVSGEVISSYGRQAGENTNWNTGVTIAAAAGSPVTAPMDGVVTFAGEKGGAGHVVIAHADGVTSHYTNVASELRQGDAVSAGMEFAQIAAGSGFSAAGTAEATAGMHFEVRRGELAINPQSILA
ncbi:rod-binding protein [Desulfovibrio sp. OttesenSCG-928-O18]|nr:rod-binding protein [Desulfovibrio sp. OttesenSCG-928-O18]